MNSQQKTTAPKKLVLLDLEDENGVEWNGLTWELTTVPGTHPSLHTPDIF